MTPVQLADYIVTWLENRNGGQLRAAIESMAVADFKLMHEELTLILELKGSPPNWEPGSGGGR